MGILGAINIGINPNLIDVGRIVLSWHGLLTFVAVAVAVILVARWGSKQGLNVDSIYSVSVWAIIGGIIGARALHVIDFWGEVYEHDLDYIVPWGRMRLLGIKLAHMSRKGKLQRRIRNGKTYEFRRV